MEKLENVTINLITLQLFFLEHFNPEI